MVNFNSKKLKKLSFSLLLILLVVSNKCFSSLSGINSKSSSDVINDVLYLTGPINVYLKLAEKFKLNKGRYIGNQQEHNIIDSEIYDKTKTFLNLLLNESITNGEIKNNWGDLLNFENFTLGENLQKLSYVAIETLAKDLNTILTTGGQKLNFLRNLLHIVMLEFNKLIEIGNTKNLIHIKIDEIKRILFLGSTILIPIWENHLKLGLNGLPYIQLILLKEIRNYEISHILLDCEFLQILAFANNCVLLPIFKERNKAKENREDSEATEEIVKIYQNLLELKPEHQYDYFTKKPKDVSSNISLINCECDECGIFENSDEESKFKLCESDSDGYDGDDEILNISNR